MKYSRALDGLRGVAILLVIFFHYNFALGCGWVGVQLFFVLSGFLITSILLNDKEAPLGYYLKRFYWRRTLRIFPLYYGYLLLVGVFFVVAHIPEDYWQMMPWLATYTFNFYPLVHFYAFKDYFFMHFWSLSVEEQFYLIWPLIIFVCTRQQLKIVLIALIVGAPLVRFALGDALLNAGYEPRYAGEAVYRFTLSQLDGFAFGALIPVFSLTTREFPAGKWLLAVLMALLALGTWNFLALRDGGDFIDLSTLGYEIGNVINLQHVWSYTLLNAVFCLLIVVVVHPEIRHSILNTILSNQSLVYLGRISYGLYVFHFFIWTAFNKYLREKFPHESLGFLFYFMICLVVASVSYYAFERPILQLKDRYFSSLKPIANE